MRWSISSTSSASRPSRGPAAVGLAAALGLLAACTAVAPPRLDPRDEGTPLDRYVATPDPAYAWEPARELVGEGCVAHVLRMTSQTWRTPEDVDRTLWWHWLTIVEPE